MEEIRAYQLRLLNMLERFDAFAKENQISYFLLGGNVLGAVRHQGFIPWDDDIDIGLYQPDYERLAACINDKIGGGLCFYDEGENPYPEAPIGKLYDLSAGEEPRLAPSFDIFLLQAIPEGKWSRRWYRLEAIMYHLLVLDRPAENRGKGMAFLSKLILRALPKRVKLWMKKRLKRVIRKKRESGYLTTVYGAHGFDRETMPAAYFGAPVFLQFENRMYPVPQDYERYLTKMYGDYMTLPPENERRPVHKSF